MLAYNFVLFTFLFGLDGKVLLDNQKPIEKNDLDVDIHHPLFKRGIEGRIVGGTSAKPAQFPYQVSLLVKASRNLLCGGSVVGPQTILTAAHCLGFEFPLRPNEIIVNAGVNSLQIRHEYEVEKIRIHRGYNESTNENDIAILILTKRLENSTGQGIYIKPISLSKTSPRDGTVCVISGFGKEYSGASTNPTTMKYVYVKISKKNRCSMNYRRIGQVVTDSMLCASQDPGIGDTCQGDSGGPLACNNELVGITSWGYGCGVRNFPGIYTDVSFFRNWIEENFE